MTQNGKGKKGTAVAHKSVDSQIYQEVVLHMVGEADTKVYYTRYSSRQCYVEEMDWFLMI